MMEDHIRKVINRINHVTGEAYKKDPTIMAWQLANEPRPGYRNELGFGGNLKTFVFTRL